MRANRVNVFDADQDVYHEAESSAHTTNHLDLGHASTMDNAIVSTCGDCDLTSQAVSGVAMVTVSAAQPAMDPRIDTSGIISQPPSECAKMDSTITVLYLGRLL